MRLTKARKACLTAMMKDTIFDAASSLLEREGTVGLTMNRVATKVGMGAASLYSYFRDKNDLLEFFYTRLAEPCFQAMDEVVRAELPAPEKLAQILRTSLDHAAKNKGLLRILVEVEYDSQIRKIARPRLMHVFTTIFEQGVKEGSFRPHETTDTSRMLLGCFTELLYLRASDASDGEVNRFAGNLIDAILNGFVIRAEKGRKARGPSPR